MQKVITVRGSTNVKVKPDYVNILINLETLNVEYGAGMEEAALRIEALPPIRLTLPLESMPSALVLTVTSPPVMLTE